MRLFLELRLHVVHKWTSRKREWGNGEVQQRQGYYSEETEQHVGRQELRMVASVGQKWRLCTNALTLSTLFWL